MSSSRHWILSLIVLFSAGRPVWAECKPLDVIIAEAEQKIAAGKAVLKESAETPLTVAPATQVAAPSTAGGGGTLVNLPGIASLLGMAQEQGLINRTDGVTTISLTPFSFLSLLQPQYSSNQQLYERVGLIRRIGGQVSFGGKGDSFDRNGDGTVDDALVAKDPNDIVTWEVKYQFGSRDRRDRENYERYFNQVKATIAPQNSDAFAAVGGALQRALQDKPTDANGCFSESDIEDALVAPEVVAAVAKLKASDAVVEATGKSVFARVDRKPIFTLVYGGTERKDEFGPNKRLAALRGAFTWLGGTNSTELSWSEVENLLGVDNAVTWKLGYNYSRSFLKGSALSKDGVTLAMAGSYEMLQDVPQAAHDSISKLNAKFSIPLTEGVDIPISVTWANHKDLLTPEEEIQGHIGFTVDYSRLRDKILGKR